MSDQKNLLDDLLAIPPDPIEKPDLWENSTNALEVLAVKDGVKPAHLNGQGGGSEKILKSLEQIALRYSLLTLRTNSLRVFELRKPNFEPEIYNWQTEQNESEREATADVLWIYNEPSLEPAILETVNGKRNVSLVLGYPECCVIQWLELGIYGWESLIKAFKETYGASTPSDVITLLKEDKGVTIEEGWDPLAEMKESHRLFSYVQFTACPTCRRSTNSPAAVINGAMRDLAFHVSQTFGRMIWQTNYKTRFPEILRDLGRNDPCPCGSGKKNKKCCEKAVPN